MRRGSMQSPQQGNPLPTALLPSLTRDKEEVEEGLVGMGGRKELERLMGVYRVKIPVPKKKEASLLFTGEEEDDDHERELQATIKKRLINVSKIERIVLKSPWERRPEEVESVRKELSRMEVFRKIDVSPAAERDICKFAKFRKYKAGDFVIRQGDIGDAFYIILEGMCNVEHSIMGVINQLFASDTFGELALVEENSVRKASIIAEQPCKMLEIKKPEYNRYIKPFHREEQMKRDNLVHQLKMFEHLSPEQHLNLMGGMRARRFKTGECVIKEGRYNHMLMFLVVGHVKVTKKISNVRVSWSTTLPNPLNAPVPKRFPNESVEEQHAPDEINVELKILYQGAVMDPDAVLARQRSNYTVTAMSQVELLCVDTITHIFVDNPVIDGDTLILIKRMNSILPDKKRLAEMAKEQVLWKQYRNHLSSHVVYKHRKDQVIKAGPFSKHREIQKDDLAAANLDNPPDLEHKSITDRIEPTDGRWPYMQPNIYRSPMVQRLLGLTPMNIMLKDKTIF